MRKTMKKIFLLIGVLSFVFPVNSFSQTVAKATTSCNIYAYVIDKDPNGLNVRSGAGKTFKSLGKIMPDEDGVMLEVVGATGGWLLIDNAETLSGAETFSGQGWVFAPMLGTSTRGKSKLYSQANTKSKAVATVPTEAEVVIVGCSGDWAKVKYGGKQGWLAPDHQCGNPVTTCP
jgi:uncharacterized protein YgiM (DUF1202 family)